MLGSPEIHHARLDQLGHGQVGLSVPYLRDSIRINTIPKPKTTERLLVDILPTEDDEETAHQITMSLESGKPLQAKIGRTRKVFKDPVDGFVVIRSDLGLWEPVKPEDVRSFRALARFVNLVTYYAWSKQNNLPRQKILFPPKPE